jgi:hypothetical protein
MTYTEIFKLILEGFMFDLKNVPLQYQMISLYQYRYKRPVKYQYAYVQDRTCIR